MFEVTRMVWLAVASQRVVGVGGLCIVLAGAVVACSPGDPTAATSSCIPSDGTMQTVAFGGGEVRSPEGGPRGELGRTHNDGVRAVLQYAAPYVPSEPTFDDLLTAVIGGVRAYAVMNGYDQNELVEIVKVEAVLATDKPENTERARAFAARLRNQSGIQDRLSRRMALESELRRIRSSGRTRGADIVSLSIATDSMRFLWAGADLLATATDSTVDKVAVISNTDAPKTYWVGQISDSLYAEAVIALEELSDSSRYEWESLALHAFIESGGDSTIFIPQYSRLNSVGCEEGREPATDGATVVACPWCLPAAAGAAGADIITAIGNYDNNVAHPVGSVVASSVAGAVFGWAATETRLAQAGGKIVGWATKLFSKK